MLMQCQRYVRPRDDNHEAASPGSGRALVALKGLVVLRAILSGRNLANEHLEPTRQFNTRKVYIKATPRVTSNCLGIA